jgi:hypothetical protein
MMANRLPDGVACKQHQLPTDRPITVDSAEHHVMKTMYGRGGRLRNLHAFLTSALDTVHTSAYLQTVVAPEERPPLHPPI